MKNTVVKVEAGPDEVRSVLQEEARATVGWSIATASQMEQEITLRWEEKDRQAMRDLVGALVQRFGKANVKGLMSEF